jgi:hypothetical protein
MTKRHSEHQRRIPQHLRCCSFRRNEWILRAKALSMTITQWVGQHIKTTLFFTYAKKNTPIINTGAFF